VRYEVDADIGSVIECNCSHCQAKGFLLTFVPPAQFRLLSGESHLTEYRFNRKHIRHLFCNACGVQSFARGQNQKGEPMIAINVRALDDIDLEALDRKPFNGRAM
jgi:hypothetical protein